MNYEKTCDTCQWWGSNGDETPGGLHRYCGRFGSSIVELEMELEYKSDEMGAHSKVDMGDGEFSDWREPIHTGPKFGCIHHQYE